MDGLGVVVYVWGFGCLADAGCVGAMVFVVSVGDGLWWFDMVCVCAGIVYWLRVCRISEYFVFGCFGVIVVLLLGTVLLLVFVGWWLVVLECWSVCWF